MSRRGRRWLVLAAVVAAVVLGAASAAGGDPVEVGYKQMQEPNGLEVFMRVGASPGDAAAVERKIAASPLVARYAHLTHDDSYAEFRRIFFDKPDLVRSVVPSDLPESFRIDVVKSARVSEVAAQFEGMSGVDEVVQPKAYTRSDALQLVRLCQIKNSDIEVFMKVQSTPAQVAAAETAIEAEPGLTIVRHLDKEAAHREFAKIFRNKPDLVQSTQASDLPESFRVNVPTGSPSDELLTRLRAIDGVDSIGNPGEVCRPIRSLLARGISAQRLAAMMVNAALGPAA